MTRLAGEKHPRACENMPPPLPLFVRFAAKSAACSLSAHGTVALCGYRRAEFDKKQRQKQSAKLTPHIRRQRNKFMEKDHYERLGVIDTAELAVIKAAYKALMQIYHPDRFDSEIEKANATQIAKEINEAYRVLSDPLLRKKYDEQRAKTKNEYNPETGNAAEDKQKNDILEDSWKIAARYVENLEGIYNALADISPELGFTFKLELIESKKFDKAKVIASRLEKEYLERYFGANRNVQNFAKWLLLNDKRQIALEVNKATVIVSH